MQAGSAYGPVPRTRDATGKEGPTVSQQIPAGRDAASLCLRFQLCRHVFFVHAIRAGGSFVKKWVCSTDHFYCKFPIIYVGFSPKISHPDLFWKC